MAGYLIVTQWGCTVITSAGYCWASWGKAAPLTCWGKRWCGESESLLTCLNPFLTRPPAHIPHSVSSSHPPPLSVCVEFDHFSDFMHTSKYFIEEKKTPLFYESLIWLKIISILWRLSPFAVIITQYVTLAGGSQVLLSRQKKKRMTEGWAALFLKSDMKLQAWC